MPLFVVLADGAELTDELRDRIKKTIRDEVSPRHVPDEIIVAPGVPHTRTGKKLEVPIKKMFAAPTPRRWSSAAPSTTPNCSTGTRSRSGSRTSCRRCRGSIEHMFEGVSDVDLIEVMGEATRDESTAIAQRLLRGGRVVRAPFRRSWPSRRGAGRWLRCGGRRDLGGPEHQPCPRSGPGAVTRAACGSGSRRWPRCSLRGMIDLRMVSTIIARTENVDDEVMPELDEAIARHAEKWMKLSKPKVRDRVDPWVAKFDPAGVRVPLRLMTTATSMSTPAAARGWRLCPAIFMPPTVPRWISAWRRWRPRCATTIRAPTPSAAPMPCGPLARGEATLACQCGRDDCPAVAERERAADRRGHPCAGRTGHRRGRQRYTRAICPASGSCPPSRCASWPAPRR